MTQPIKDESQMADSTGAPMIGEQRPLILAPPAGGTGATAGAYDTAANRDLMIASINAIISVLERHGLCADN